MGKPTGFLEYLRELPADRTPVERVANWKEFHHHMDEGKLRQQGARCMDCGVPFCHTGKLVSGMAGGASTGCTRPTTFRNSPGASAPPPARDPASSGSTARR